MLKKFGEVYGLNENFSPLNEAKKPDMIIPADDSSDIQDDADHMKGILKKAGVDADCKAGLDEIEIYLKNKADAKKAQKAIEKAGYQIGWNESEVHEAKAVTDDIKEKVLQTLFEIVAEIGDSDIDDHIAHLEAAADEMESDKLKDIIHDFTDDYGAFMTNLVNAIAAIKKLK